MALEDRLHAHWSALFPDRILTVPYEALVHAPEQWMERVLSHVGLPPEPGVMAFHGSKRAVRTASVSRRRPSGKGRRGASLIASALTAALQGEAAQLRAQIERLLPAAPAKPAKP